MDPTPDPSLAKRPRRRRLSAGKKLAFSGGLLLLLALAAEGWGRLSVEELPEHQQTDPRTGYVFKPNHEWESSGYWGDRHASTNSLGHRTPELISPKPADEVRIVCLGGSAIFGFGAPTNAEAFPAQLQRLILARGTSAEVFNAGIPGWSTRDSLTNYQERLEGLGFDYALLLEVNNDLYEAGNPVYRRNAGAQSLVELEQPGLLSQIAAKSAALRALGAKAQRHRLRNYKLSAVPPEGAAAYSRVLKTAVNYLRLQGVEPILCTYPHLYTSDRAACEALFGPERLEKTLKRSPLEFEALAAGLDQYNDLVRAAAAELGVTLIDLAKTFPRDKELYVDYIHQNARGHLVKAEQILEGLRAAGFVVLRHAPR